MSQVDEAVLDLTASEASLLADVLGVAPPPGLVDPDDDRVVARTEGEIVAPGLIERRLLDAEGTVAAPVADLLTVVGCPHLVARAVHEVSGVAEIRSFAARPEMAVEQRGMGSGQIRFTPFDPADLVDRIMAFVAPESDGPFDDGEGGAWSLEVPAAAVERLFSDVSSTGDGKELVKYLVEAGVEIAKAEAFVSAVKSLRSTNSVTVLHRPVEQEIVGVDLTWMDAGDLGIWLTEPAENSLEWRVIECVSPAQLAAKLAQFLPFG